ncbi:Siderophore synthetase component [Asanoa hainanensis]|uniref:Siderophore synthetase component n=1 Tax=Asanoa hainanensis TaxID=560556 RepID=A0A239G8C7_9ACTN|nr:IucA/IucC family protein [Asanoa hainanensis]SNS64284.1 Siderophore synthetase component [Asanoa hainanensis]
MSGTTAEPLGGPDPSTTARWLESHRPDLHPAYLRELPAARAAIRHRLVTAIAREHLRTPSQTSQDPAEILRAAGHESFAAEVDNSVANLALAQATQPRPDGGPPALTRPTPPHWEQLVVDGHPLHPGCRTRTGMTTADVLAYAPEHRTVVDLVQVAVPEHRWHTTGAGLPPLLHLHPWQAARIDDADLRRVGTRRARPLMSLRTLAPLDDPTVHLKTAIDAQLTSAVRTVSPAAVENGPNLTALLQDLTQNLTILREYAAGAVLTDGRPDRRLSVLHRQAPPPEAIPVGALSAPSPADGAPLAREAVRLAYNGDPRTFLADLTRLLVRGPLELLDRGIGLEAHGQNTLVTLHHGRPATLYYRDVGGIRVDPKRLEHTGVTPPPLHGDLTATDPDEPETTVLAALTVVFGQLVGTLAGATDTDPAHLWAAVARTAGDLLTHRDTLPIKATTTMRLAADPLEPRWAYVPNPLLEHR